MKALQALAFCCLAFAASVGQTAARRPAASRPAAARPASPDVYLVTIDTLRPDHLHCYGDDAIQTPAIDALASDGIRFTHAFTPSPITNTSHTSILTGLLPSIHGVTDFGIPLAASHTTLAEALKKKGYHTAAFIGAIILDSKTLSPGLDRGFDFYDNFPEHSQAKERWGRVERRGMDVVQHAEAYLSAHRAGPRFLWIHLYDPHDPYEPPSPYSATYKDRLYDGEIAYADSALAHFIAYLKQQSLYANSLIILVADHGEGLGEHKEETHGIFLYDSTTHVPLIAKLPEQKSAGKVAGKVIDAQVRTTDIFPTVLDWLAVPLPSELSGESLKPLLVGDAKDDRAAYGETDYPLRFGWAPLRSVRSEGFKLIEAPRPELYDLSSDAKEMSNLYQPEAAPVARLRGLLTERHNAPDAALQALPDPKDKIEEQNLLHTAMLAADDNRESDARAALEATLKLNPQSPTALRQLGELELKANHNDKAAEYLKRAREVRPDDATAAYEEGQARIKIGDFAGARDALEASLKSTPGQLQARLMLGDAYLHLNDAKAAQDQFEAAQLIDGNSADAQLGLAKAQIAGGDFTSAAQQLEALATAQPRNADVQAQLALAYDGLGKKAEAQAARARAQALRDKK